MLPDYVYADLETYSSVPIEHGVYAYAKAAKVLIFAYALDDGEVKLWLPQYDSMPDEILDAYLHGPTKFVFHNSQFDRVVLQHALPELTLTPDRIFDTMVQAYAHGLPGKLETLGECFGLADKVKKMALEKNIMKRFCTDKKGPPATPESRPDEWERFKEYAKKDITAMRTLHRLMPNWNTDLGEERRLWFLDQKINDRGLPIDLKFVEKANEAISQEMNSLKTAMAILTGGQVTSPTQRDALLNWLKFYCGLNIPDLQKHTVEKYIADPKTPVIAQVALELRQDANRTSNAKYQKVWESVDKEDGRLRGLLQFCGATRTGRWSGRLFQPQNLPRPELTKQEIDRGITAIREDAGDIFVEDTMVLTSSAIRGMIKAPEGSKLLVADLSNIEGRVAAWYAGEDWKLRAFRDYDEGRGDDVYKLSYAKAFDVDPEDVTKDQRQIGKVMELALGYGGGAAAFAIMAQQYDIDLEKKAVDVNQTITAEEDSSIQYMISQGYNEGKVTSGLSLEAYRMCEVLKMRWRAAHPEIARMWKHLEKRAFEACILGGRQNPFELKGRWLTLVLPSGRRICYPAIRNDQARNELTYVGMNGFTRKWERMSTYGGKLFENVCQAIARDVLTHGMMTAERFGYPIILTVHDEIVAEVPDTEDYSVETLSNWMATNPPWSGGLPLLAEGFETYRYGKD